MKKKSLLISICLIIRLFSQAQNIIAIDKKINVDAAKILATDFNDTVSIMKLIYKTILGDEQIGSIPEIGVFVKDSNLTHSAVIFVRHGYDASSFSIDQGKDNCQLQADAIHIRGINRIRASMAVISKRLDSAQTDLSFRKRVAYEDYVSLVRLLSEHTRFEKDTSFIADEITPCKHKSFDITDTFVASSQIKTRSALLQNITAADSTFNKYNEAEIKSLLLETFKAYKSELELGDKALAQRVMQFKSTLVEQDKIISNAFHKERGDYYDYLLDTKDVLLVFLGGENDLQKASISIKRKTSFFKQSFLDLQKAFNQFAGDKSAELPCRIVVLRRTKVKPPCDINVLVPSKDTLTFAVHEKNLASFQVGLVNNNFHLNNFSLNNGNLVVTPDTSQKKNWKSNLYAIIELHLPRDIDNFQPIWKTIIKSKNDKPRTFATWLYDVTLSRIGIYGGVKISDDPLSNLYAGLNYAIAKEICVNFGFAWNNEVVPQVKSVGDISSLSDALKYAHRSYSAGKFSIGLSFAPSVVVKMFAKQ